VVQSRAKAPKFQLAGDPLDVEETTDMTADSEALSLDTPTLCHSDTLPLLANQEGTELSTLQPAQ
jgi:hypothetical protein